MSTTTYTTLNNELFNQMVNMTTALQNLSNYIGMLTSEERKDPEYQALINATKEHLWVSHEIETQIYAFEIPTLTRSSARELRQESPLISDGQWQGFHPNQMEIDADADEEDEEDEECLPPPPVLTRQMTNNWLNLGSGICIPTEEEDTYRLPVFVRDDSPELRLMSREDSVGTTLARGLEDDSVPQMPVLIRQRCIN